MYNYLLFLGFVGDTIARKAEEGLRALMFMISSLCYELIIFFYNVFVRLGTAEILTSSQVQRIYSRVTLILGLFMLFKMLFSFIQYLVDPDVMTDKSKGASKLVLKVVVVIVLLGTVPFIFQTAFRLQRVVLESNILGKIILSTSNADDDVTDFGGELSSYLFYSFYSINDGEDCDAGDIDDMIDETKYNHTFKIAKSCLNEESINDKSDYVANFPGNGVLSLAVGIFTLYIILSYCLSVGMRVVQLAFLQLISPIPIISYLGEDKDGAFSKWVKRCISTFLDLFIRMAIIYFVVYIISFIMDSSSDSYLLLLSSTDNPTGMTKFWLIVIIILGLLMFAKKAPDLIKEVLPEGIGGNDFGFSLKNRFDNMLGGKQIRSLPGKALGFGAGAIAGGAISGVSRWNMNRRLGKSVGKSFLGAAGGIGSGMISGARAGMKDGNLLKMGKNVAGVVGARRTADNKYNELIATGGNTVGKLASKIIDVGGETRGQRYTRFINRMKDLAGYRDAAYSAADNISSIKADSEALAHLTQREDESDEAFRLRKKMFADSLDNKKDSAVVAAADGHSVYTWDKKTYFDKSSVKGANKTFSFDFSKISSGTGDPSKDFELMEQQLSLQLDNQIANYVNNGGSAEHINKQAIMDKFLTSYGDGSLSGGVFNYEAPDGSDRKASARAAFEEQLNQQISNYIRNGKNSGKLNTYLRENNISEADLINSLEEKKTAILESFDSNWAGGTGEFEYEIADSFETFTDADNRRVATIQANYNQAKSYAEATGAEYWDPEHQNSDGSIGGYVKVKEGFNGTVFRKMKKHSDNTTSHITGQSDYQSSIANDKAAGVDSNASSKSS